MPSLAALFQRNIIGVHAEVARAYEFNALFRPPQVEALQADHHHALAVFQRIRRHWEERLRVHERDEVGRCGKDLAVYRRGQVLVLELDIGAVSLALADAIEHDLAEVEARARLAQHIRDLALEELEALGHFEEVLLGRFVAAVLDGADGAAELLTAADDAVHAEFLHLLAAHGVEGDGAGGAAAHRDRAGELFRPFVGDGLEDAAVALLIHKRHGRSLHAADGKGDHLQFGNARPMPSTSTIGIPRRAAAAMGSMELTPPASMGMKA